MSNLQKRLERLEANAPPPCPDPWHLRPYVEWPPDYEALVSRYASTIPAMPPRCPTCNGEPETIIKVVYQKRWPDGWGDDEQSNDTP